MMLDIDICGVRRLKIEHVVLDSNGTIAVGNGANDVKMLRESALEIAVLQEEGLAVKSLLASALEIGDILNLFEFFEQPGRLVATLRQ